MTDRPNASVTPLRRSGQAPMRRFVDDDTDIRDLLPAGDTIDAPVLFGHDVWDLAGHISWKDKAGAQTKIDFQRIPPRWRLLTKHWTLASITPAVVGEWLGADHDDTLMWTAAKEPTKPVTAQGNVKQLGGALERLDAAGLEVVDAESWDHVTKLMRTPVSRHEARETKTISATTCKLRANQLRSLDTFGRIVGWPDPFGSTPWGDLDLGTVFKKSNQTRGSLALNSVRPHEAVGHVLGVAAFIIDHLADDIIAHLDWWQQEHTTAVPSAPSTDDEGKAAMAALYYELAAEHDGHVPGAHQIKSDDSAAHTALAYLLGEPDSNTAYQWGRYAIRATRRSFGGDITLDPELSPCPLPIRTLPHVDHGTPTPWTARLLWDRAELKWWGSALLYAVAYYLNATLGLRDPDRALLSPGCVRAKTVTTADGTETTVYEMHAYKQKQRMAPKPTTFAVGARVARAIALVEQLHDVLGIDPTPQDAVAGDVLFDFQLNLGSARQGRHGVYLDLSYMNIFREAAKRLKDAGVVAKDLDGVPDVTSQQVRITVLQAYAARPLGQALAAAYGQWNELWTMQGYTGDVIKQIVLADPEEASDFVNTHIGVELHRTAERMDELTGNGVVRLKQAIGRHAPLANGEPLTLSRAKRMGGKQQNWESGPFTACLFQPDGALCGGQGSADFRLCRPGECRNSVMTRAHRARVELRRRKDLSLAPILRRDADKIAEGMPEVVAEFDGVSNEELVHIIAEDVEDYIAQALEIGFAK